MTQVSSKPSSPSVRQHVYFKLSQSKGKKIQTISIAEVQLAKFEDS